ncbi:MAG: PhnD/SsuA/transferrin family substrate-binding protein [Deltaproteobacteria bacterium]|nr:PhnD/SsuA/transferrin family substrate-binding protein [Deltaproteobacteria bacterium]
MKPSLRRMLSVSLLLCLSAIGARADDKAKAAKPGKGKPSVAVEAQTSTSAVDENQTPIKFALSAPLGIERAKEDAQELASMLTKVMGRTVVAEVVASKDIPKLLAAGKIDIGFLSAMEYLDAADLSQGRVAPAAKLVRSGLPFYRSVLFTRVDVKGISTPKDVRGKRLAFVSETSASGFQLPRLMLMAAGLSDLEIRKQSSFLGDHAAVCKAVLDGRADVGATISNDRAGGAIAGCAETEPTRVGELRVVALSDPIPNDVFVVRPDLPPQHFQSVRNALVALSNSPEGKKALADIFSADAFVAADDSDFAMLRGTLHPQ